MHNEVSEPQLGALLLMGLVGFFMLIIFATAFGYIALEWGKYYQARETANPGRVVKQLELRKYELELEHERWVMQFQADRRDKEVEQNGCVEEMTLDTRAESPDARELVLRQESSQWEAT